MKQPGGLANYYFTDLNEGGEDTAHGWPPWLVSAPTEDNLKCTQLLFNYFKMILNF